MRRIAAVLLVAGGLVWGCDALEPRWSEAVEVAADSTCNDVCALAAALCLENSCDGGTVGIAGSVGVPAECEEAIGPVMGDGPGWTGTVSCCCGG